MGYAALPTLFLQIRKRHSLWNLLHCHKRATPSSLFQAEWIWEGGTGLQDGGRAKRRTARGQRVDVGEGAVGGTKQDRAGEAGLGVQLKTGGKMGKSESMRCSGWGELLRRARTVPTLLTFWWQSGATGFITHPRVLRVLTAVGKTTQIAFALLAHLSPQPRGLAKCTWRKTVTFHARSQVTCGPGKY